MAGVAFLNVVKPNWLKKIKLDKLDLHHPNVCVIGEVTGNYGEGISKMGIDDEQAEVLGFYSSDEEEYPTLTKTWKKVLKGLGAK